MISQVFEKYNDNHKARRIVHRSYSRNFKNKNHCLFCGKKLVNSHSLPHSKITKFLANSQNDVLHLKNLRVDNLEDISSSLEHSRKTGIFHLLCEEHDRKLFMDYEQIDENGVFNNIALNQIALKSFFADTYVNLIAKNVKENLLKEEVIKEDMKKENIKNEEMKKNGLVYKKGSVKLEDILIDMVDSNYVIHGSIKNNPFHIIPIPSARGFIKSFYLNTLDYNYYFRLSKNYSQENIDKTVINTIILDKIVESDFIFGCNATIVPTHTLDKKELFNPWGGSDKSFLHVYAYPVDTKKMRIVIFTNSLNTSVINNVLNDKFLNLSNDMDVNLLFIFILLYTENIFLNPSTWKKFNKKLIDKTIQFGIPFSKTTYTRPGLSGVALTPPNEVDVINIRKKCLIDSIIEEYKNDGLFK